MQPFRIVIYACGMGGSCRSLTLARHISEGFPGSSILVLTDLAMFGRLDQPDGVDYLHIPEISGENLPGQLASRQTAIELRGAVVKATLQSFEPHLVLVDRYPVGLGGELAEPLGALRRERPSTRLVLGLPDVPGAAPALREQWERDGSQEALRACYDEAWVYGAEGLHDLAGCHGLAADLQRKLFYTGYLRHRVDPDAARQKLEREGLHGELPLVLVSAGSGRGGFPLLDGYLSSLAGRARPLPFRSHLVCGPLLPAAERKCLEARVEGLEGVTLGRFHKNLDPYLSAADAVVSVAGYNTCCQLLSFQKPALVWARSPEERLRAGALAERRLLELLPERFAGPDLLPRLETLLADGRPEGQPVSLAGLETVAKRLLDGARAYA